VYHEADRIKVKGGNMRWFRTVILLAVLVLTVGCLPPTTPTEAGAGVSLLGGAFVLWGLGISSALFTVERKKLAALLVVLGACFLLGARVSGTVPQRDRFQPLPPQHADLAQGR
jgi:hypothetical protein